MASKAVIDFTGYTADALAPVAEETYVKLSANAATFPSPAVTMLILRGLIDDYNLKLANRASRSMADTLAFNIARHELEGALHENGVSVNQTAKGSATKVELSGYPAYQTGDNTPDTAPPAAPKDLVLRQGDLSGSIVARYHPDRDRSMNIVHSCNGDPNVEANWQLAGTFSGGKAVLSGLAPGTTVWVRVCTAGLKGVLGAWSDPAKIMVT